MGLYTLNHVFLHRSSSYDWFHQHNKRSNIRADRLVQAVSLICTEYYRLYWSDSTKLVDFVLFLRFLLITFRIGCYTHPSISRCWNSSDSNLRFNYTQFHQSGLNSVLKWVDTFEIFIDIHDRVSNPTAFNPIHRIRVTTEIWCILFLFPKFFSFQFIAIAMSWCPKMKCLHLMIQSSKHLQMCHPCFMSHTAFIEKLLPLRKSVFLSIPYVFYGRMSHSTLSYSAIKKEKKTSLKSFPATMIHWNTPSNFQILNPIHTVGLRALSPIKVYVNIIELALDSIDLSIPIESQLSIGLNVRYSKSSSRVYYRWFMSKFTLHLINVFKNQVTGTEFNIWFGWWRIIDFVSNNRNDKDYNYHIIMLFKSYIIWFIPIKYQVNRMAFKWNLEEITSALMNKIQSEINTSMTIERT